MLEDATVLYANVFFLFFFVCVIFTFSFAMTSFLFCKVKTISEHIV